MPKNEPAAEESLLPPVIPDVPAATSTAAPSD